MRFKVNITLQPQKKNNNLTTISHDGCAKLPHKLVNLHFVKIPEAR